MLYACVKDFDAEFWPNVLQPCGCCCEPEQSWFGFEAGEVYEIDGELEHVARGGAMVCLLQWQLDEYFEVAEKN